MLVAFENEGPIEQAGETIDEAAEDIGDTAEAVVDAIDDAIEPSESIGSH